MDAAGARALRERLLEAQAAGSPGRDEAEGEPESGDLSSAALANVRRWLERARAADGRTG